MPAIGVNMIGHAADYSSAEGNQQAEETDAKRRTRDRLTIDNLEPVTTQQISQR